MGSSHKDFCDRRGADTADGRAGTLKGSPKAGGTQALHKAAANATSANTVALGQLRSAPLVVLVPFPAAPDPGDVELEDDAGAGAGLSTTGHRHTGVGDGATCGAGDGATCGAGAGGVGTGTGTGATCATGTGEGDGATCGEGAVWATGAGGVGTGTGEGDGATCGEGAGAICGTGAGHSQAVAARMMEATPTMQSALETSILIADRLGGRGTREKLGVHFESASAYQCFDD